MQPILPERQEVSEAPADGLVVLRGFVRDDAIQAEIAHAEIARLLGEGHVVILKGVFPPEEMLAYRRAVTRWRDETPPYPHGQSPNATPDVNYHRADTGEIPSAIPHIFHQYGFNTPARLPDYVGLPTQRIARLMLDLQNNVGGTRFDISVTGMRVKLLHYPAGGGFLTEHQHPLEPQRVGLIASLSRIGEDFRTGGTTFKTPFGRVDTDREHDIGDIILFRYDLPHVVGPVDEDEAIDWPAETGKWSFVLDLRETHGRSQVK